MIILYYTICNINQSIFKLEQEEKDQGNWKMQLQLTESN
jgi:hypothetical protein